MLNHLKSWECNQDLLVHFKYMLYICSTLLEINILKIENMKKGMSEKDFVEYIENRGYKFSEDLTKKDKKGTDWYRKVLPLPNGAELIINVRVWKVLDVYTYIEDKKREIKTDVDGFAFNIKEGFSRTGFNVSLWMAVAMTTQDYRNKSGDVDFKINRDDLGIEVFN